MGDDALYVRWNGGGGIGDPLDRSAEKVTADIAAGLISKEAASEVYGVIENAGVADRSATKAKRTELRQARLVGLAP
jgi:N-methylhydantoinase B